MAVQVLTRDFGYIPFPAGDAFAISDGVLTIYDEGSEAIGSFSQWIGVLKADS